MIDCAYCGKSIGNEHYNKIEQMAYWTHVKNKHFKHPLFQKYWGN